MVNDWDLLYGSARGRRHQRRDLPNQDAFYIRIIQGGCAVAVADGHGSTVCFRSDLGAKVAVKLAVDVAARLWPFCVDDALSSWCQKLISAWFKVIKQHFTTHPFRVDEIEKLSASQRQQLTDNPHLAYGSTVIAAAIINNRGYFINLGDGDLLIKTARDIENVVRLDDAMLAGSTYSLSAANALSKFASTTRDLQQVRVIMLSTDGYRNSFAAQEDFYKVVDDLQTLYNIHSHLAIHDAFKQWLRETSDQGSGDDISAVVLLKKPPICN